MNTHSLYLSVSLHHLHTKSASALLEGLTGLNNLLQIHKSNLQDFSKITTTTPENQASLQVLPTSLGAELLSSGSPCPQRPQQRTKQKMESPQTL